MHYLSFAGLLDHGLKFRPLTLPDRFIDHNQPAEQYRLAGLDRESIMRTALTALGRSDAAEGSWRA
jgi:1-deoxy-D-xylulose-5-phosphate synthase